ncbi:Uncharacterised protein [Mycobacterium tuberculosis]|nr:Uncharacterised protein [Mycobacterium tuberculosis]
MRAPVNFGSACGSRKMLNDSPKTTMSPVTHSSSLRRPMASAIGPESSVKMPKNTTPMICINTKSV